MRVLIRTAPWQPERYEWARELLSELGDAGAQAGLVLDEGRNALDTFEKALAVQGGEDAWHMEDDVILTSNFVAKARAVQAQHGDKVIQVFSRRRDDLTVGSRLEPGSNFIHHQCFYLPGSLAGPLAAWSVAWRASWRREESHYSKPFTDIMMSDFLKHHGLRYWLVCPNLIDHRSAVSLLANSTRRQSVSFVP